MAALATGNWPCLGRLWLGGNNPSCAVGQVGIAALARARWPALRELCVEMCDAPACSEERLRAAFPEAKVTLRGVEDSMVDVD